MTMIPKYLDIEDEHDFESWKRFAEFARTHTSEYMSREEREIMMLDLYQVERGYQEGEEDYRTAKETYAPFLKQVSDKISRLILINNNEYNWDSVVSNFGNRRPGADFADIIAHDLVLVEKSHELLKELRSGRISIDQKFESSKDKTAFKIARIIEDKDHENYMV